MSDSCASCQRPLVSPRGLADFAVDNLGKNPGWQLVEATILVIARELRGFCSEKCEPRLRLVRGGA